MGFRGTWLLPAVWAIGCSSEPPAPAPTGEPGETGPPASPIAPASRPAGGSLCTVAVPDAAWTFAGGPSEAVQRQLAVTDDAIFVASPHTLRRSDDGGQTWTVLEPPFAPSYAMRMAGLGGELFFSTGSEVVRSADGGRSWVDASSGLDLQAFQGIQSLQVDGDILLAVDWGGDLMRWSPVEEAWVEIFSDDASLVGAAASDGTTFLADVGFGVHRSTDLATWQLVEGLEAWGYRDLYVDGELGLAITFDGQIRRSTDAGLTWTPIAAGVELLGAANQIVRADDVLYAVTTNGIARSMDGGTTWLPVFAQPSVDTQSHLAASGGILAADVGGMVASVDGGASWSDVAPIHDTTLATFGLLGSTWIASTEQRSVYVSTNAGGNWYATDVAGYVLRDVEVDDEASYLLFSPRLPGDTETFGASFISRRAHGATSFEAVPLPYQMPDAKFDHLLSFQGALFVAAENDAAAGFVTTGAGVWVKHDGSSAWSPASEGLPPPVEGPIPDHHRGVAALDALGDTLVALLSGDGDLYQSVDAGTTWTPALNDGVSGAHDLAVARDRVVLASRDPSGPLVAWSPDLGEITLTGSGLPSLRIETLIAHENLLFAAVHTDLGEPGSDVYVSADGGDHWQPLGLQKRVRGLSVQGGRLLAGAEGEAIWSLPLGACVDAP